MAGEGIGRAVGSGSGVSGQGVPGQGALTRLGDIEERMERARGNLCLITAGSPENPIQHRQPALLESVVPGQAVAVRYLGSVQMPEADCPVQVEVISEASGLMRFHSATLGGTEEVLMIALSGRLEIDRRRWPRVALKATAEAGLCNEDWREVRRVGVVLNDLSPLGAGFEVKEPLPVGQRLLLRVGWELPPLPGQVVRLTSGPESFAVGVVFRMTNEAIRRFLIRHLAERSGSPRGLG